MDKLGVWILPGAVVLIVAFGLVRRGAGIRCFSAGAKEGAVLQYFYFAHVGGTDDGLVTMLGASGAPGHGV